MLGKYWRLHFYWVGDQTLTYADGARVNVRMTPWKLDSGDLSHGSVITDDMGFTSGTIVTTGTTEGDVQDNTSNIYWGIADGQLEIIADLSSTDGDGYLYVEYSDDNSNWPSDKSNFDVTKLDQIAAVNVATDAVDESQSGNFSIAA